MTTVLELAQKMLRGEAPPPPIGRLLAFALKSIEPGQVYPLDMTIVYV